MKNQFVIAMHVMKAEGLTISNEQKELGRIVWKTIKITTMQN